MAFKIRQAKKEDLAVCAKIIMKEFNKQGEGFSEKTSFGRVKDLFNLNSDYCFCMELNGEIIGLVFCNKFIYAKGDYLWIEEFAVKEGFQGKGFGQRALSYIEDIAKKKGVNVIGLAAKVKERAISLYERSGFKRNGYINMEKELQ